MLVHSPKAVETSIKADDEVVLGETATEPTDFNGDEPVNLYGPTGLCLPRMRRRFRG